MKHHNTLCISIVFICTVSWLILLCHAIAGSDPSQDSHKWPWRTVTTEKYEIPSICKLDYHNDEDIIVADTFNEETKNKLSNLFEAILEIKSGFNPTDPKLVATLAFFSRIFSSLNENTTHASHFIAQKIAKEYLKLEGDKYVQYVLYNHMDSIERVCGFLITLREHIQNPREKIIRTARLESNEWRPVNIIMAGAGPVGLMSAIEAYSQGADPELFEKRNNYTRNTWFDLEPLPWSTTKLKLNTWGIQYQDLERVLHDENEEVDSSNIRVTMRTLTLEKYLSKVAAILGININFGWKFISVCDNDSALFIRSTEDIEQADLLCAQESNENVVKKDFNLLLGSEGTQSIVRQIAGIEWTVQNTFDFVPFKLPHELVRSKQVRSVSVNDLQQVSALVNFKPINGECPRLNQGYNIERLDPLYPTFVIPGVISVWKRFFSGDACQLQLLFNNSIGNQIVEQFKSHAVTDDEAYPWHHIHQVVQLLFEEPVASIDEVKQLIATKNSAQLGREVFSIEVLPVQIYRASATLKKIINNKNNVKILAIAGDASVTAHFRLGVGINNAFLGLKEFSIMMQQLSSLGANKMDVDHAVEMTKIIGEKENRSNERLGRLVQFELSTMYYESYCDFVLFFDDTKENYWERQSWHRPNRKKNVFVPVHDLKFQECYAKAIKSSEK